MKAIYKVSLALAALLISCSILTAQWRKPGATESSDSQGTPRAEPFGFKEGMTRAEVIASVGAKAIEKDNGDILVLTTAPKPHPDIDFYVVMISSKGVSVVEGVSTDIPTNSFGEALQQKFKEFQVALEAKYGKARTSDFLLAGSIWKEPQDWMMGLLKDERKLNAVWSAPSITEKATASSPEAGYVRIWYEFPSYGIWTEEHNRKANSAF